MVSGRRLLQAHVAAVAVLCGGAAGAATVSPISGFGEFTTPLAEQVTQNFNGLPFDPSGASVDIPGEVDFTANTIALDAGVVVQSSPIDGISDFGVAFGDPDNGIGASFTRDVFEVGLLFGNDDPDENIEGGGIPFSAKLSAFDVSDALIGAVSVDATPATMNDLVDQFIGLQSSVAIRRVYLSYLVEAGTAASLLPETIDNFTIGFRPTIVVPVPAALPLLLTALVGLGLYSRRRRPAS